MYCSPTLREFSGPHICLLPRYFAAASFTHLPLPGSLTGYLLLPAWRPKKLPLINVFFLNYYAVHHAMRMPQLEECVWKDQRPARTLWLVLHNTAIQSFSVTAERKLGFSDLNTQTSLCSSKRRALKSWEHGEEKSCLKISSTQNAVLVRQGPDPAGERKGGLHWRQWCDNRIK